jgi:hypothetical protein
MENINFTISKVFKACMFLLLINVGCFAQPTFYISPHFNYFFSTSNTANLAINAKDLYIKPNASFGVSLFYETKHITYGFGYQNESYENIFSIKATRDTKKDAFRIVVPYEVNNYLASLIIPFGNSVNQKKIKTELQLGLNLLSVDFSNVRSNVAAEDTLFGNTIDGVKQIKYIVENTHFGEMHPAFNFGFHFCYPYNSRVAFKLSPSATFGFYTLAARTIYFVYSSPKETNTRGQEVSISTGTNFRITGSVVFKLFTLNKKNN